MAEGTSTCGEVFCNKQLEHYYQLTDNIVFHFKPLRKDSLTQAELQKIYTDVGATYNSLSSQNAYNELVVSDNDRPEIAVMDNEARFNITRGAIFEDIIFRGDYGMITQNDTSLTKSPRKLCIVNEKNDLYKYGAIELTKNAIKGLTTPYDCSQVYF